MTSFWRSADKLAKEGLKVAWFGVMVIFLGLLLPDARWLGWFGFLTTVMGLILRHRAEHLKFVQAKPRELTELQHSQIKNRLKDVPKLPLTVGFFGQDPEAEQFASQIKVLLESEGFHVVRLEGFMVFKLKYGLTITAFNADSKNATALGIQQAFVCAGMDMKYESNPNRMDPMISLNVHGKQPPSEPSG